jgi:hypothetical protein
VYLSIVSGLSIALSIFMLLFACFHFSKQRRRPVRAPRQKDWPFELTLSLFGVLWWIAGAITATIYGNRADSDVLREEDERTAVWSLSWVNVGLFSLLLGLEIIKCCFEPRKNRYPGPGIPSGGVQSEAPPFTHHVAAPPASPIPASPFIVPGYPTSTIQMYGGYPLATEPPPSLTQSR